MYVKKHYSFCQFSRQYHKFLSPNYRPCYRHENFMNFASIMEGSCLAGTCEMPNVDLLVFFYFDLPYLIRIPIAFFPDKIILLF